VTAESFKNKAQQVYIEAIGNLFSSSDMIKLSFIKETQRFVSIGSVTHQPPIQSVTWLLPGGKAAGAWC